jgi:hypothetical protein
VILRFFSVCCFFSLVGHRFLSPTLFRQHRPSTPFAEATGTSSRKYGRKHPFTPSFYGGISSTERGSKHYNFPGRSSHPFGEFLNCLRISGSIPHSGGIRTTDPPLKFCRRICCQSGYSGWVSSKPFSQ